MKILFFSTDYRPLLGGIAAVAEEVARVFARDHDVVMVAPLIKGSKSYDKKNPFKTRRALNIIGIRELIFICYLIYYIVFKNYRTVYNIVWFPCSLITYLLSGIIKFNYYSAGFGTDYIDDKRNLKRRIKSYLADYKIKAFNKANRVLTCSNYSRDVLIEMGVRKDNISVVAPGVDINKFTPIEPGDEFIKKYNIAGKKILLTTARLEAYKGQDTVLKILPRLIEKHKDLYYYIVGEGKDRKYLEGLVEEAGLTERVVITGAVSDEEIIEFYRACDIFVMVSRQEGALVEGFGITYVEAAACGKVVVGGRSGGTGYAVNDGVSGILVDPLNAEEVFNNIDRFMADDELRLEFGKKAREWVVNERTWEASAEQTLKIMQG